jgi:hypothetical protein
VNNNQIAQANRQNKEALQEELDLLQRCIKLTETSALNAGILVVPEGVEAVVRTDAEEADDVIVADMLEGLPYTFRGPEHLIKDIKWYPPLHINLDVKQLRERAEYIKYRIDLIDKFESGVVE